MPQLRVSLEHLKAIVMTEELGHVRGVVRLGDDPELGEVAGTIWVEGERKIVIETPINAYRDSIIHYPQKDAEFIEDLYYRTRQS